MTASSCLAGAVGVWESIAHRGEKAQRCEAAWCPGAIPGSVLLRQRFGGRGDTEKGTAGKRAGETGTD